MRLKLERDDGARRMRSEYGVFDEATGKCVGTVQLQGAPWRPQELPHKDIRLYNSN